MLVAPYFFTSAFALNGGPLVAPTRAPQPQMFGFLKKLGLEKPDFLPDFGGAAVDVDSMSPKNVVVTGGANGVGYAYADSFMKRGHNVVICDVKDPSAAVAALEEKHQGPGVGKVYGCITDVSKAESVEALGAFAKENLGTIHYWINNAGINGGRRPMTTLSTNTLEAVVNVNLIGLLLCTKVALDTLQAQAGVTSHIFNTVGSGVKGGGTPGYAAYGATKRGLPQLTDSLVKELTDGVPGFEVEKPAGDVRVHTISPGMVFTKLLLDDSTPELRKFPFGVLAAQPEEVRESFVLVSQSPVTFSFNCVSTPPSCCIPPFHLFNSKASCLQPALLPSCLSRLPPSDHRSPTPTG